MRVSTSWTYLSRISLRGQAAQPFRRPSPLDIYYVVLIFAAVTVCVHVYIYIYMYICISHHITPNLESTPKRHLEGQSTFRSLRWTVFEERRPRTGPETGRRPAKIRVRDYINWYITYILTNWSFIITNNEMMSILHTNSVSYYS